MIVFPDLNHVTSLVRSNIWVDADSYLCTHDVLNQPTKGRQFNLQRSRDWFFGRLSRTIKMVVALLKYLAARTKDLLNLRDAN